jgi:putative tryptophan/tyrosine transport system substrate-binding protein
MKRRQFITLIGSAAAWPLATWAQPSAKVPRLGVLLYSTPQADPQWVSLRQDLRGLGYIEGQNLTIEFRYAEGKSERLQNLAIELASLKPDALLAFGGDVAPFAVNATQTIPVLFMTSADPVGSGLVASLARPGGNATGVTLLADEIASKRLEILKEVAPRVSRIAFLWNPDHRDNEWGEVQRAAQALNVQLAAVEVRGSGDLEGAFRAMREANVDALYIVTSRQTLLGSPKIVDFATKQRLPLVGGYGNWAQAGGLISYGTNLKDIGRQLASYVDNVLKGANPADLPVLQPTKFELIINLKTAKALGLEVPWFVQQRADAIIE